MAKSREAALKRAREKARLDKKEAKRHRREQRLSDDADTIAPADETALMEEFARLSERHDSNEIGTRQYEEERHRIFVELGLESDE